MSLAERTPVADGSPSADWAAIDLVLRDQEGVISRSQATALGAQPHDLRRLVRHRSWVRVVPGVYVNHTGPLSWRQRAWVGVLHYRPAALAGRSALRAVKGAGSWNGSGTWSDSGALHGSWHHGRRRGDADQDQIEIAVAADRHLAPLPGYQLIRTRGFADRVQPNAQPPRIRFEHAVIDLAACARTDLDAIGVLAGACGSRRTTAQRLLDVLAARSRIRRRHWLVDVLNDVADGTCSALEHAHLILVESPHGLPRGIRQAPANRTDGDGVRRMFRDVLYKKQGVIVELDGRLFHESTGQRDADMDRDLDAAVDGHISLRLSWGQCTGRPCHTAAKIAKILRANGWEGTPTRCGPNCAIEPSA